MMQCFFMRATNTKQTADAQGNLSLCLVYMSDGMFSHIAAPCIIIDPSSKIYMIRTMYELCQASSNLYCKIPLLRKTI